MRIMDGIGRFSYAGRVKYVLLLIAIVQSKQKRRARSSSVDTEYNGQSSSSRQGSRLWIA